MWPFFRLGEAKWQHSPTCWMLVTSSSASSVLDTENGDVYKEQRMIIWFLHLRGMKPIEIHQQLSETCNDGVMDVKNVCSWVRQFKEGQTLCEKKNRRSLSHALADLETWLREWNKWLWKTAAWLWNKIAANAGISVWSVDTILHYDLKMWKSCASCLQIG